MFNNYCLMDSKQIYILSNLILYILFNRNNNFFFKLKNFYFLGNFKI